MKGDSATFRRVLGLIGYAVFLDSPDVEKWEKDSEEVGRNERGFGRPPINATEFQSKLTQSDIGSTHSDGDRSNRQDEGGSTGDTEMRDINRESENESPGDKEEGWNLVRSKRERRRKKDELTNQGSGGSRKLSEARGLTRGTRRDQG